MKKILDYLTGWVARHQRHILSKGERLTLEQKKALSDVGIVDLDKIRVCYVDQVPLPSQDRIGKAFGDDALALCLNHGIYIRKDAKDVVALLRHEVTHTFQYYRYGGIRNFLAEYIRQFKQHGYDRMPLEREAVRNENV